MAIELSKQEVDDIVHSLRKYCKEELEQEISGMQAKFLLDYIMKEIAPFAYNKGIKDAEAYFQAKVEDLPGICFEEGMTYWHKKRK
ncbi:protein of unknown function DUF2164 [Geotalea daltonii FRC-32]|uniref:DUF2164 domain-containing protein n=1 Tax=Geotalea daltonii (strain DSM 22248 / JCM 15807 / FRC-32) TaxID=316067 RepID=B9M8P6_GEODF|nr:DUF2164 domain-containing protein [Geotalea daltonii]ACM20392.1 protein of unknown function DUF2164 [Geotalea daltonii FRC-32]